MTLDGRKQKILGAVVRDYVETVKPIGSEELVAKHDLGVKSATIRNELAELADLGYLRQPHTSAGRIPSDMGYRFYVDHLMDIREIEPDTAEAGPKSQDILELDKILRQMCSVLTRMTSYTSVATPPQPADTKISQIHVSPAGENRLLVVLVLSTGQVENRLIQDTHNTIPANAFAIGVALSNRLGGNMLHVVAGATAESPFFEPPSEFDAAMRSDYTLVGLAVRQMAQNASSDENVFLEGATEILRQPEFRDVTKIESVLITLQQRTLLFQIFSRSLLGPDVTVVIGEENQIAAMHECSIVTASYYIGSRERGTIGVVGPTRMNYDRAVPAVNFIARSLSQTLTRISGM